MHGSGPSHCGEGSSLIPRWQLRWPTVLALVSWFFVFLNSNCLAGQFFWVTLSIVLEAQNRACSAALPTSPVLIAFYLKCGFCFVSLHRLVYYVPCLLLQEVQSLDSMHASQTSKPTLSLVESQGTEFVLHLISTDGQAVLGGGRSWLS